MATVAEKIVEIVKDMPEQQAAEVLDFARHLKAKQNGLGVGLQETEVKPLTPEGHAAWVERMRAITAAQPMTQTTVEDMRREARY